MSNVPKTLYVGVTNNLMRRVYSHKYTPRGFVQRYHIHKLVFFEDTNDIRAAIEREKEIKGWSRNKKIALVESMNPRWNDLGESWYGPARQEESDGVDSSSLRSSE